MQLDYSEKVPPQKQAGTCGEIIPPLPIQIIDPISENETEAAWPMPFEVTFSNIAKRRSEFMQSVRLFRVGRHV